jgi:hypothetical protein
MTEFVSEPWTNDLGQTINPGDEVIFAGTSWKQTTIRKGIFGGVRYGNVTRSFYVKDENGDFIKEDYTERWSGKTYQRNKMESKTTREVVAVRVEKVNRGFKYKSYYDENGKYRHEKTDEIDYGVSTLPLKRVYKIDTTLAAAHR